jgi:hypothetical protein
MEMKYNMNVEDLINEDDDDSDGDLDLGDIELSSDEDIKTFY